MEMLGYDSFNTILQLNTVIFIIFWMIAILILSSIGIMIFKYLKVNKDNKFSKFLSRQQNKVFVNDFIYLF